MAKCRSTLFAAFDLQSASKHLPKSTSTTLLLFCHEGWQNVDLHFLQPLMNLQSTRLVVPTCNLQEEIDITTIFIKVKINWATDLQICGFLIDNLQLFQPKISSTIYTFYTIYNEKILLVSMVGRAEGQAHTDPGARTPIGGGSGILLAFLTEGSSTRNILIANHWVVLCFLLQKTRRVWTKELWHDQHQQPNLYEDPIIHLYSGQGSYLTSRLWIVGITVFSGKFHWYFFFHFFKFFLYMKTTLHTGSVVGRK